MFSKHFDSKDFLADGSSNHSITVLEHSCCITQQLIRDSMLEINFFFFMFLKRNKYTDDRMTTKVDKRLTTENQKAT